MLFKYHYIFSPTIGTLLFLFFMNYQATKSSTDEKLQNNLTTLSSSCSNALRLTIQND